MSGQVCTCTCILPLTNLWIKGQMAKDNRLQWPWCIPNILPTGIIGPLNWWSLIKSHLLGESGMISWLHTLAQVIICTEFLAFLLCTRVWTFDVLNPIVKFSSENPYEQAFLQHSYIAHTQLGLQTGVLTSISLYLTLWLWAIVEWITSGRLFSFTWLVWCCEKLFGQHRLLLYKTTDLVHLSCQHKTAKAIVTNPVWCLHFTDTLYNIIQTFKAGP